MLLFNGRDIIQIDLDVHREPEFARDTSLLCSGTGYLGPNLNTMYHVHSMISYVNCWNHIHDKLLS
jgi:hypothetical protein